MTPHALACLPRARWLLHLIAALTSVALALAAPLTFLSTTPAMLDIPGGDFIMGFSHCPLPSSLGSAATFFPNGDADEQPAHTVSISAFRIAATETTNAQYELFDLSHKLLRGKYFFSHDDDDAVRHAGVGGGGVPHSSLTLARRRCCGCPTTRRRSTAAGSRPDWPTAGRALSPPLTSRALRRVTDAAPPQVPLADRSGMGVRGAGQRLHQRLLFLDG